MNAPTAPQASSCLLPKRPVAAPLTTRTKTTRPNPSLFARIWCSLFGHDGPTIECTRIADRVCLMCGKIYIPKDSR